MTGISTTSTTAVTVATEFLTAGSVEFAHRHLGQGGEVPLVLLQPQHAGEVLGRAT